MALTAPLRLLLVHAHPDDESIWTGGTIARYAAAGAHVSVVTCTLGEEGEIIPDGLRGLAVDQADQLGGYRLGELRSACMALGVTEHRYLGGIGRWRDSGMVDTAANANPRAFIAGDLAEQTDQLSALLSELKPNVVITYGPDGGYGHPDHIRAHQVTLAAVAAVGGVDRVYYTVNSRTTVDSGVAELATLPGQPFQVPAPGELTAVPDEQVTTVIDITGHLPAKLTALRAHATQISVWRSVDGVPVLALSNGIAQPVPGVEHFTLVQGDPQGTARDLFGVTG
ncbi:N-acetyl-1-D-myo-inositol-2-amino-2-deoxy-alpha-D-glucopyranoside deacetylase [Pseudonocardiaceae bacterium YIM PH 21723]|nr:N-acetyl-1-D-myo-inositol-2-amino-2-deoxy-alpha-D-glucopyranoside deacetylase [Pseudonocardiaceae bacterium YIM PH 21723]